MKRILQIVPRLPPLVDGLGDYAVELGTALAAHHGFSVEYLVTDPAWRPGPDDGLARRVERLARPSAIALVAQLQELAQDGPFVVLLHYVGYAYQPRGCPAWLVDGLTGWRRGVTRERRRLVVMFHELFASGPPWSSAFWLSFTQRRLSARLARLSDALFTNSERYARWLARLRPEVRESIWPVLSNVGELPRLPERAGRERALAVFGLAAKRALVYRDDREQLLAACAGLGITRLHDIGPRLAGDFLPGIPGVEAIAHGPLPKPEVSALLARCAAGFIDNGDGALGKSGVFAAFCSHGVTPIACKRYPDEDGLVAGVHYLTPRGRLDEAAAARVAAAAHAWYGGHGRPSLAAGVARLLNGKDLR
jgi:hypothetical protein